MKKIAFTYSLCPYVDVLKTQQMRLAEQPIYGSSRVGVASYWPGQYDAVWDYTTGTQDTLRLLGIKPWYSATLEGYKPAGSTEPYDNSSLGLASAAHLLGQKSYELSNHLGNVQATLSDKRYVQKQYYTASDSLRKGYAASVSSLYDYYPFGMLMKERCTSDTATQSVYMSQVVYSPQYTTVNNAMTGASITTTGTTAQTNYNGSISYTGTTAGIKKVLSNLIPNVPVSIKIKVLYNYKPLYIAVGEASAATPNSYTNLLYSTMSNGSINFTFTPTQTNVELSIKEAALTPSIFATSHLCFTIDSVNYTQQNGSTSSTQLVQISSKQSDKYRFGFNGQEKDNEIAGVGNHNTAEFWEYDTRVGRRWNVDPLVKPWESSYSCFANNPLWFMDLDGADTVNASKNPGTGKWEHTKTIIAKGNDVFNITYGKYSQQYIFSEGESGKRMSVLNLESNDDYTLGLYHISGSVEEGSTGFTVTPGGAASAKNGSGKRLPDDTYSLSGTGNGKDQSGYKWVQPLLFKGESNGNVGGRGVKIHPAASKSQKTQASLWTEGCYVVSTDYSLSGGRIYYDSKVSIKTSNQINKMLGATKDYNSVGNKNRPGSDFGKGIQFKLIQKSGFKKY